MLNNVEREHSIWLIEKDWGNNNKEETIEGNEFWPYVINRSKTNWIDCDWILSDDLFNWSNCPDWVGNTNWQRSCL